MTVIGCAFLDSSLIATALIMAMLIFGPAGLWERGMEIPSATTGAAGCEEQWVSQYGEPKVSELDEK